MDILTDAKQHWQFVLVLAIAGLFGILFKGLKVSTSKNISP